MGSLWKGTLQITRQNLKRDFQNLKRDFQNLKRDFRLKTNLFEKRPTDQGPMYCETLHPRLFRSCVAICGNVLLPWHSTPLSPQQCVAVCCSVLQCVAVCCSVLQCVAVCCSVLLPWDSAPSLPQQRWDFETRQSLRKHGRSRRRSERRSHWWASILAPFVLQCIDADIVNIMSLNAGTSSEKQTQHRYGWISHVVCVPRKTVYGRPLATSRELGHQQNLITVQYLFNTISKSMAQNLRYRYKKINQLCTQ
jgi:hypothetical protein